MRILFIDDEAQLLIRDVEPIAEDVGGLTVVCVENAAEGVRQIDKADILLLDVSFPPQKVEGLAGAIGKDGEAEDISCFNAGVEILRHARTEHPNLPVVMLTDSKAMETLSVCTGLGVFAFVDKPLGRSENADDLREALNRAKEIVHADRQEAAPGAAPLPSGHVQSDFVARSPSMRRIVKQLNLVASTDSTILLLGENGTGKEMLARLVHRWSERRGDRPVVANLAGLNGNLLQSELFGHLRGAFTGAVANRTGLFEEAGTERSSWTRLENCRSKTKSSFFVSSKNARSFRWGQTALAGWGLGSSRLPIGTLLGWSLTASSVKTSTSGST